MHQGNNKQGLTIESSINSKSKLMTSKLSITALFIGLINIVVCIFYFLQIALWLAQNSEVMENPDLVNGMQIPNSTFDILNFIVFMAFIGILCGFVGTIKSKKMDIMGISGLVLNALLLSFAIWKS